MKQVLIIGIPSIISFLSGYFIYKLNNTIINLQRRINIQALANSYKDDFWGDIQITHNKKPISHLHFIKVDIINNTNKDVDRFKIQLTPGTSNKILSSHAMNMDTKVLLSETDEYQNQVDSGNWDYLNTHREYEAKVLNRKSHITINLLVSTEDSQLYESDLIIAIEKKGVKLIPYKAVTPNQLGTWGILLGIIVVIGTAFGCYIFYPESKTPTIILGIVGSIDLFIGMVIYYAVIGWGHWSDDDKNKD
uniref:hypothetical protein n=1 Tax=Roseivirga sp. TaxID=1964215 RepID=UPI004048A42D